MGFSAEMYKTKISHKNCVNGNLYRDMCEILNPDFFDKIKYNGKFKVTRERILAIVANLENQQMTFLEYYEKEEIKDSYYNYSTLKEILDNNPKINVFYDSWDC